METIEQIELDVDVKFNYCKGGSWDSDCLKIYIAFELPEIKGKIKNNYIAVDQDFSDDFLTDCINYLKDESAIRKDVVAMIKNYIKYQEKNIEEARKKEELKELLKKKITIKVNI